MRTIHGYDTKEARDFSFIVDDKVYDAIKSFLLWYKIKHPRDVIEFNEVKNESNQ